MTDVASGCFIVPQMLSLLREGPGSPIWRMIVTPENCVQVNAACLAVILLCVGFVAKRMCFWYEPFDDLQTTKKDTHLPRSHVAPFLAMLAFAVVPQFADNVTRLSPFLLSLSPLFLSAAVVASLNTRLTPPGDEETAEADESRRFVWVRLALAGALAAAGVWESTYGILFAPLLLVLTWFSFIRRRLTVTAVSAAWIGGFMAVFLAEPELLPHCPWTTLSPRWVQVSGFVVFFFVGVMPLAVVRRLGENRWTVGGWTVILLVFATITVTGQGRFALQSASERFVRHVLSAVGDREYLIGDGYFDVLIDEYKPAGLKRIGTKTVEEREFLINLFGNNEPVTNRILFVNRCYDFAEMAAAFREVNPRLTVLLPPTKKEKVRQLTAEEQAAAVRLRQAAFNKKWASLAESLETIDRGIEAIPESLRKETIEKARENIRLGWKNGFGGLKMSEMLLRLDLLCGDVRALEADALTALILDREDPAANAALGQLRLEAGKLEDAERYLRKAVKGGGALAMSRLAMLLVNTGRLQEAGDWARKAVALCPKDWNMRQPLAAVLIETGRREEAERELDEIWRLASEAGKGTSVQSFVSGARRRLVERCK